MRHRMCKAMTIGGDLLLAKPHGHGDYDSAMKEGGDRRGGTSVHEHDRMASSPEVGIFQLEGHNYSSRNLHGLLPFNYLEDILCH